MCTLSAPHPASKTSLWSRIIGRRSLLSSCLRRRIIGQRKTVNLISSIRSRVWIRSRRISFSRLFSLRVTIWSRKRKQSSKRNLRSGMQRLLLRRSTLGSIQSRCAHPRLISIRDYVKSLSRRSGWGLHPRNYLNSMNDRSKHRKGRQCHLSLRWHWKNTTLTLKLWSLRRAYCLILSRLHSRWMAQGAQLISKGIHVLVFQSIALRATKSSSNLWISRRK